MGGTYSKLILGNNDVTVKGFHGWNQCYGNLGVAVLQGFPSSLLKGASGAEFAIEMDKASGLPGYQNFSLQNRSIGKVCFLTTGVGRMDQISVGVNAVLKLADHYCSPVLFCELECEKIRIATAQGLIRMLQICSGHVPGVSALSFSFLMKNSVNDSKDR
uniref:Centromere protein M n=1 Tax=Anolis carolinensis TaxID=28377 RepID=H9G8I9_ANOCA